MDPKLVDEKWLLEFREVFGALNSIIQSYTWIAKNGIALKNFYKFMRFYENFKPIAFFTMVHKI